MAYENFHKFDATQGACHGSINPLYRAGHSPFNIFYRSGQNLVNPLYMRGDAASHWYPDMAGNALGMVSPRRDTSMASRHDLTTQLEEYIRQQQFLQERSLATQGAPEAANNSFGGGSWSFLSPSTSPGSALKQYEDNLCLLMQEFEMKARHEYILTRQWPKPQCEVAALRLSIRLDDIEWRKVPYHKGYMEEIDAVWRAKMGFARKDMVYQVVWEYVAGMARRWAKREDRHRHCYQLGKHNAFYLERAPSIWRQNKWFRTQTDGTAPPTHKKRQGYIHRWSS